MTLSVNTNIASLNAQRNLNSSQGMLNTSLKRLSSGLRINSAKDDAAGLAITNRMTSQVRGLNQAARNANDGISLAQTAEGALQETTNILQRLRELSIQSANDTNSSSDRQALQAEASQLISEMDRIAETTKFNGKGLLNGSFSTAQFQVGADANQTISFGITGARTSDLGSYQATGTAVTASAFDGDGFTINGVEVGVSAATSAAGVTAGSATAKATAINSVFDQTGVTATASNSLTGAAPNAGIGLANGDLLINGIAVGSIAKSTSAVTQGRTAADAINAISNQTGVTATASASTGALTLSTSDGRDIALTAGTVDSATAQKIQNAIGLDVSAAGNASGNESSTLTFDAAVEGSGTGLTITDQVKIDNLTYEFTDAAGQAAVEAAGNVAVVIVAGGAAADSITALEGAIDTQRAAGNTTVDTGAKTATTLVLTSTLVGTGTLGISEPAATNAGALAAGAAAGGTAAADGDGVTTRGTLTLSSAENYTLGGADLAYGGVSSVSPALSQMNSVDISTVEGSNAAISVIDGAISQVGSIRGDLGAIQSRFESTIANLQSVSENISAARSRVLDADFALETANLTKGQILQQAGIAMLAQANQLPQAALSLLQ
ncbi:MAG: flagellin [Desulfobacterales bacterium]|jgi:flagellin|nr:flagellin [Desulfobacterales bacterium]